MYSAEHNLSLLTPAVIGIPYAVTVPFPYENESFGRILITRIVSILLELENINGKISVAFRRMDIEPTEQERSNFFMMEDAIKTCVTNAEAIYSYMKSLILQFLCPDNEKRATVQKMDFMKLKDHFLEYVKNDLEIKKYPLIDTGEKFKTFRRNFQAFIMDRNIYTHGQLRLFKPSLKYIIQYENSAVPAYVLIDREIILSYNNFYVTLHQFLNNFQTVRAAELKKKE